MYLVESFQRKEEEENFVDRTAILTHFAYCRSIMSRSIMVHKAIVKLIKITISHSYTHTYILYEMVVVVWVEREIEKKN